MLATCWFTDAVDRSCKVAQRRKYRTCCKLFLHSSVLNRSYSWLKKCESSLEPFIWKFSGCGEDTDSVTANFPDPKHLHQCTNCHCGLRCSRQVLHPVLGRCRHVGSICPMVNHESTKEPALWLDLASGVGVGDGAFPWGKKTESDSLVEFGIFIDDSLNWIPMFF